MSLKDFIGNGPGLDISDLQRMQKEYDRKFVDDKFTGFDKVRHTYAHIGKLIGRLATYVQEVEDGGDPSPAEIREKVIPDLLVYSAWLANVFDVDMERAYARRFLDNLRTLRNSDILSPIEMLNLSAEVYERFPKAKD